MPHVVELMPNGDQLLQLSPEWYEVQPANPAPGALAARVFYLKRATGETQWDFPEVVLDALRQQDSARAAPLPPPPPGSGHDELLRRTGTLERQIAERNETLSLLREMGCREDDTADLEADLAALRRELSELAPAPAPTPVPNAHADVPLRGADSAVVDHDELLRRSTTLERQIAEREATLTLLHEMGSNDDDTADLEADLAALRRELSELAPASAPLQIVPAAPPSAPMRPSTTSEETIRRRIAEQEATLAMLRGSGVGDDELANLEADIASLRAAILPPSSSMDGGAGGGEAAAGRRLRPHHGGSSQPSTELARMSSAVVCTPFNISENNQGRMEAICKQNSTGDYTDMY
jgi:uncharacterized coiled-coil protein SlyX